MRQPDAYKERMGALAALHCSQMTCIILASMHARMLNAGAGTSSGKLTHIQLYTELQPKCQDLRFLASAVQNVAETRQGGVVLGQLYTHAEHGSQHVHKVLLIRVST